MTVFATDNKTLSKLPKMFTTTVTAIEVVFVLVLGYFVSSIAMSFMSQTAVIGTRIDTKSQTTPSEMIDDFSNLIAIDAFFGGIQNQSTQTLIVAPESTLDLKIFGLRTNGGGKGTAILKPQGEEQKLYQVGEKVSDAVRLTSVFHDRIEINRNGIAETIYLDKERSQQSTISSSTMQGASQGNAQKIEEIITALDLDPFRKNNRISGFVIGSDAQAYLLSQSGLETGDMLHEVNGEELVSWERLQEIPEKSADVGLNIKFERHGEIQTITLSNLILGL